MKETSKEKAKVIVDARILISASTAEFPKSLNFVVRNLKYQQIL